MWPNPLFPADLVTFTEENLNGKLHFWAVNGSTEVNNAHEKDCCKDVARLQQTSRMESFAKLSILDSCEGPRYPSGLIIICIVDIKTRSHYIMKSLSIFKKDLNLSMCL